MAAIKHGTLTADTAASVTHTRDAREVGVMHKGNVTAPMYARLDGAEATVAGDDTYTILPGIQRWIPRIWSAGSAPTVSIISSGAVDFEVEFP
jgi:hypothetical protein